MTRLLLTTVNPGTAAHPAKNAPAAPGSTEQSRNRTEEPQMVDTTTAVGEVDAVAYTHREWNRLISQSRANVLFDAADALTDNAADVGSLVARIMRRGGDAYEFAVRAQVYRQVAEQLQQIAVAELESAGLVCPACGEAL